MLAPLVGICLAFYFGYHAINGTRGLLAVGELDRQIAAARATLEVEAARRDALQQRVSLLCPQSIDPELLEERARQVLNFGRSDDVLILEPPRDRTGRAPPVRVTSPEPRDPHRPGPR